MLGPALRANRHGRKSFAASTFYSILGFTMSSKLCYWLQQFAVHVQSVVAGLHHSHGPKDPFSRGILRHAESGEIRHAEVLVLLVEVIRNPAILGIELSYERGTSFTSE